MKTCIALLRGINVGGKNILPMKELASLLADLDLQDVRTYIQSGNAVFGFAGDTSELAGRIGNSLARKFGFTPQVMVLTAGELAGALAGSPFRPDEDPRTLHLFFLAKKPGGPDLDRLESLKTGSESFALRDRVFYLHAPEGIGRSKLAAQVEKCLGVPVTARNRRTVVKLLEMAG